MPNPSLSWLNINPSTVVTCLFENRQRISIKTVPECCSNTLYDLLLDVNNPNGPTLETSFSDFGAGLIKGVGNVTTIGTIVTSFRLGGA